MRLFILHVSEPLNFLTGAKSNTGSLVKRIRLNIEDSRFPICRFAASLLNQKCDWISFIHKAKLSILHSRSAITGVEEYAALRKYAMNVANHRAHPAHVKVTLSGSVRSGH